MGENTHQNCTRQNKNKEDPGRQQPCWGFLFCTNLTQPTGNLDSAKRDDLLQLLRYMNEQEEMTILVVTHDSVVAQKANRVLHMMDGKIVNDEVIV